jgi:hypothetical protein
MHRLTRTTQRLLSVWIAFLLGATTYAYSATSRWALTYEGDSFKSQNFLYDKRVERAISSTLGIRRGSREMAAFQGVPSPVVVNDGRFIWTSSCEAHECPFNLGLYGMDAETGEALAARAQASRLASSNGGLQHYLVTGSTKQSYSLVAAQAKGALIEWIRRQRLTFISVVFRCDDQHDVSCIVPLKPSDFSIQNAGQ